MKLELLILTQPSRAVFLSQLMSLLAPQVDAANGQVGIRTELFEQAISLGENRERMRQASRAEYIVFIDDDDLIVRNYVSSLLPLLDGVDQVTFNFGLFRNGKTMKPAQHSLKHGVWTEDTKAYYRDISHATPMRRDLALQVPMSGGVGEDYRWATAMRGKVLTENHIDDILYYYLVRVPKSDERDSVDPFRLNLLRFINEKTVNK